MDTTKKNLDIEVLRGFAILFVLFHHRVWLLPGGKWASLDNYITFWGGVDLFLVISGFVIGRGLLKNWQKAETPVVFMGQMGAFWIRRAWRIWPIASLWMLIPLIGSVLFGHELWGKVAPNATTVASILTGTQNIHAYLGENGFVDRGSLAYVPYWSLSLEEQFYLLFPVILFALMGERKRMLAPILIVLIVLQLFAPRAVWSLAWALRSDALLFGVLIAYSLYHQNIRKIWEPTFLDNSSLRWVILPALLVLIAIYSAGKVVPFSTGAVALLSAILVWIASYNKSYLFPLGKLKTVLVYVGGRSYSIYLVHMNVFFATRELWAHLLPPGVEADGRYTLRFLVTAVPLVFVLSELSYRFVETPLREKGRKIAGSYLSRHLPALEADK